VRRLYNLKGILVILVLAVLFYSQLPLGSALSFGEDEGCEFMKAVMCNEGFKLYTDIWNDQPPVFTLLLGHTFKLFGTSLLVGRLVAGAFGTLMFAAFFWLVEQRVGFWRGLLAGFFLIAAPQVALLSVSVMLEVPAFATGLLAVCLLFQWCKTPRLWWLLASGIVLGIALQIKLTAILLAPAMLVEIAIVCMAGPRTRSWKIAIASMAEWGMAVVTTVLLIIVIWARGSIISSWQSHFAEQSLPGLSSAQDFPFQINFLESHAECVLAALVAIAWIIRRRGWRQSAFPVVLLACVSVIHAIHRPWWSYYYLHLAIPLAWLSALAVGEAIAWSGQLLASGRYRIGSVKAWQAVLLCLLTGYVLVRSERRLETVLGILRARPSVANNPVVNKMRFYAKQTRWVYADQEIYPFHAGLNTPPELTVVVFKRFWSGQITAANMVETCRHYGAEQLLLNPAHRGAEWGEILNDYDAVYQDTNVVLYVAKRITSASLHASPEHK